MAVTWITPTDILPGTVDDWIDADVSGSVPEGATGVILHFENPAADAVEEIGWRKNGSSDDRTEHMQDPGHIWCACGIDSSRILELYVGDLTTQHVWLVGYFGSESAFFTNAPDKSLGDTADWYDIDISGDTGGDTAIGAFFETVQGINSQTWGFRKNGSSDARFYAVNLHCAAAIGVDGSEICEGYISSTDVDFFLNGYIKSEATFHTNGTDESLGSTGSYVDLTALAAGATGGIYEVISSHYSYLYALRENGSAEDIYHRVAGRQHAWGMVECDGSRLIEGKISNTGVDFFEIGYFSAGEAPPSGNPWYAYAQQQ